ncbi:MAG: proton extrusion protein PcxA [Xenococcaceae cyanobacterium]
MKLPTILQNARQWFSKTPERALEQAYRAALSIKEIEDEHFNGQKVSAESSDYSNSVITYFQAEVKRYLNTAKMRLSEFKVSRSFLSIPELKTYELTAEYQSDNLELQKKSSIIIEKLNFIDEVVSKYENGSGIARNTSNSSLVKFSSSKTNQFQEAINYKNEEEITVQKKTRNQSNNKSLSMKDKNRNTNVETVSDKTSVLPRSLWRTFNRIKQEIAPNSEETEEEVLKKFRTSRNKTAISIKFLLVLIIVPLLTHQLTKTFLVTPIVKHYFTQHAQVIFINSALEEEAVRELHKFKESLEFKTLIGIEEMSPEKIEEKVKDKAKEIGNSYRERGSDAIANIFADIFSLFSFALVILISKREILIVKSFIDEIIYGLSDSAKAFLIILFTDMFVGYHSPHGWEVILEGISRHFGFPETREFNFLFIATFPVILDTVLKYWIFRYLNRISPSAVATYKNMNE